MSRQLRQSHQKSGPSAQSAAKRLVCGLAVLCFLCSVSQSFGQSSRVVAIGDIHGDFDAFVGILQRTGLVDPSNRWSGGNATLVQTGDFLDRGPKARAVMDLLMSLQ